MKNLKTKNDAVTFVEKINAEVTGVNFSFNDRHTQLLFEGHFIEGHIYLNETLDFDDEKYLGTSNFQKEIEKALYLLKKDKELYESLHKEDSRYFYMKKQN